MSIRRIIGTIGRIVLGIKMIAGCLIIQPPAFTPELRARLEPLTGAANPFRHTAREVIALAAWRTGDLANAKRWFDMIVADGETPAGTRSRIDMLIALAAGDGKG